MHDTFPEAFFLCVLEKGNSRCAVRVDEASFNLHWSLEVALLEKWSSPYK
jgi:hypothetical protein